MNITIVGGGNIGTQFAVHCANKEHNVIIYTSKFALFKKHLFIVDENDNITKEADIAEATDNPKKAFSNADLIFVTTPSFCIQNIAELINIYAPSSSLVCLVPGCGGGEFAFRDFKGILFGMQRVPSVARVVLPGEKVKAVGYRKELFVSALNNKYTKICNEIIHNIFDIKCNEIPCYLNLTLTPSNPILHTTRLYSMFKDYCPEKVYETIPMFYEDWDNNASELLLKCDEEVQNICHTLDTLNLSYVVSLKKHYEANNAEDLTNKIRSIKGFKGIKTPMVMKTDGKGFIPDFSSRYFIADFAYGLIIFKEIADICKIQTPNIDELCNWYKALCPSIDLYDLKKYNIVNKSDLIEFYSR